MPWPGDRSRHALGALLDSTIDRTGESLVLGGIAVGIARASPVDAWGVASAVLAMTLASGVTYVPARAEGLGVTGDGGIAPRPERLMILAAGLTLNDLSGDPPSPTSRGLIVALSALTMIARMRAAARQMDARVWILKYPLMWIL